MHKELKSYPKPSTKCKHYATKSMKVGFVTTPRGEYLAKVETHCVDCKVKIRATWEKHDD